jgi:hypothetical protein
MAPEEQMTATHSSDETSWLTACAWCDRVRLADRWVGDVAVIRALGPVAGETRSVTHSICPDCFASFERRRVVARERLAAAARSELE